MKTPTELQSKTCRPAAFTLIELLVVIAVIAVLAALLFPMASRMQESAKRAKCLSNIKQCGVGMAGFAADNNGRFPKGYDSVAENWATQISRYFGDQRPIIFRGASGNSTFTMNVSPVVVSPMHKSPAFLRGGAIPSSYVFNQSALGLLNTYSNTNLYATPPVPMALLVSPSKTFLLALGVDAQVNSTAIGARSELSNTTTRLGVNGKTQMLFADGHAEIRNIAKSPTDNTPGNSNDIAARSNSPNEIVLYR